MKRLAVFVSALFAVAFATASFAQKIGVVDMQKIFRDSAQVKQINTDLTKQFSGSKKKIMVLGKALQKNLKDYQKNKSVMSAANLSKLKAKITKQEMQLRQEQAKFQRSLYVAQNKKMGAFVLQVKKVVQQIAKQKQLTMVLPKNTVLYAGGTVDITSQVVSSLK